MARHSAEWWKELVAEVGRGADAAAVAERHGVTKRHLEWWRTEFSRRTRLRRESRSGPRLLPVVAKCSPEEPTATAGEIVIERGDIRIHVRGTVPSRHVEAVVRGLVAR